MSLNFTRLTAQERLFQYFWVLLVILSSAQAEQVDTASLRHVFLVYRHGDRSPLRLYAADPNPASSWKEGLGRLTNKGKLQHYELGKYLRERYRNFLTDDIQEVYVRSSAVDRCLQSAACSLASLYEPSGDSIWKEDLKWQPLPIHSTPIEIDTLLNTRAKCPEYDKEVKRIRASTEVEAFLQKHSSTFQYLTNFTGEEIDDLQGAYDIYEILLIEKLYGLKIPDWVEPVWKELEDVALFSIYAPYSTRISQRFRGGSLLGDIVSTMKSKAKDSSSVQTKLHIYSTHDSVTTGFLSGLGVFNRLIVPYAGTAMVELHEHSTRTHTVRIYYRNETESEPYPLTVPGCEFDCPLDSFIKLTEDVVPLSWDEACGLKGGVRSYYLTASFSTVCLLCFFALTSWFI